MPDIVLAFEVHQPLRVKRDFFWGQKMFHHLSLDDLHDYYFDSQMNQEIFRRASEKCYLPANNIVLEAIENGERSGKPVKVAFSISGVFLEQCNRYGKDVLESFRKLGKTGCVEFIGQTYYHSLASFFPAKEEFIQQVEMHRETLRDLLDMTPTFFENTEFLYNNAIASQVEDLGFQGMLTEGSERILGNMSPNHVYRAKGTGEMKVLLRNYKLTDDVAFRFSARWWSEWPLTADKYAGWLASTPGDCIVIFPDYETFGEHQWPETGIHEFFSHLFTEISKHANLSMVTPSEAIGRSRTVGEVDVPEHETVSWADIERGLGSWLGNTMQWAYFTALKNQKQLVAEAQSSPVKELWRYFQTSDHLYYMFASGGGPGDVHAYFNPFGSPVDAFVTCFAALLDFDSRLRQQMLAANEAFSFYTGVGEKRFTGVTVQSLKGFQSALEKVDSKSLEFHGRRGDFERWFRFSLGMADLAEEVSQIANMKGKELRSALLRLIAPYVG